MSGMKKELWATARAASLQDILQRREARAQRKKELPVGKKQCLISFCMNIPGERKSFPLARRGFEEGLSMLRESFGAKIVFCEEYHGVAGDEALLVIDAEAPEVKRKTVALEQGHPFGRVWDMDVLDAAGNSLSRTAFGFPPRSCLICGGNAKACGRSRRHPVEEALAAVCDLLESYFVLQMSEAVADCGVCALVSEVSATPKPGLVDRSNSGSHDDMDYAIFVRSANALRESFARFFRIGYDGAQLAPHQLFHALRREGQAAESVMFTATNGVNTHKGMIFSTAVFCGALGKLYAQQGPDSTIEEAELFAVCAELGKYSLEDFEKKDETTEGLWCYNHAGVRGIRGEAASGFASVRKTALPALRFWQTKGVSSDEAAAAALLALIAETEDTNMMHRGGMREALRRREEAAEVYRVLTPENLKETLQRLDADYIAHHLSPGGCADLLGIALLVTELEEKKILHR